jgi:hypothetical protein
MTGHYWRGLPNHQYRSLRRPVVAEDNPKAGSQIRVSRHSDHVGAAMYACLDSPVGNSAQPHSPSGTQI